MDINAITQLIGSLGFPIIACGYMMVKMNKTIEQNTTMVHHLCDLVSNLIEKSTGEHVEVEGLSYTKDDGN